MTDVKQELTSVQADRSSIIPELLDTEQIIPVYPEINIHVDMTHMDKFDAQIRKIHARFLDFNRPAESPEKHDSAHPEK